MVVLTNVLVSLHIALRRDLLVFDGAAHKYAAESRDLYLSDRVSHPAVRGDASPRLEPLTKPAFMSF